MRYLVGQMISKRWPKLFIIDTYDGFFHWQLIQRLALVGYQQAFYI